MAQPFNSSVMTNSGLALLNKAQAGECSIEFIAMATGDGVYTAEEETEDALRERTSLKSQRNSYDFSSVGVHDDTSVRLRAMLTNWDSASGTAIVTESYYINEIGIFAKEKGGATGTEILYSIATTTGDHGDTMPAYDQSNPTMINQDYFVSVDDSLEVSISVVTGEFALQQDLEDMFEYLLNTMVTRREIVEGTVTIGLATEDGALLTTEDGRVLLAERKL